MLFAMARNLICLRDFIKNSYICIAIFQTRMKILVIGDLIHFDECRQKLGEHDYTHVTSPTAADKMLAEYEVTFDFMLDRPAETFGFYATKPVTVFINTCMASLALSTHSLHEKPKGTLF